MSGLFPIMISEVRDYGALAKMRADGLAVIVIGIPWELIGPHEKQALRNHSQSLKRLAERGGLSSCEAMAVLDDRPWRRMSFAEAQNQLLSTLSTSPTKPHEARQVNPEGEGAPAIPADNRGES